MRAVKMTVAALLLAAPAAAQSAAPAPAADQAVATNRMLWQQMTGYITTTAEELPDSLYAYKPSPDVRTAGQLIGHVAGAQYLMCAAALGEAPRAEDAIERTRTTKAELVQALKESTAYCEKAYAQTDAQAMAQTELFGMERSRLFALALNATHNAEHYGNLVTYMRINGIVPPSSRPRQ